MSFLNDVYLGEKTYNKITGKILNVIKIFIVSTRKFMLDDCLTKASAIAYTTVVSLIPTLTVGLTFYSIFAGAGAKKEDLFRMMTQYMTEHNIKLNIDPVIESISSLIDNAAQIGGIGAVVMVFTATAVLRSLESSLNSIWQVERQRPVFLKIIYYWAALTLGPLMLIAGTAAATQVSAFFSAPSYNAATIASDGLLWVTGQKMSIQNSALGVISLQPVKADRFDMDNQRVFDFDPATKTFKEQEYRLEEIELRKHELTDIQFINNRGWVVGKGGLIFTSYDRGTTWLPEKWGGFNFRDIHMLDAMRGFIAADDGYLLKTEDGGKKWTIQEFGGFNSNLNSITFYNNTGIITADRGALIMTTDGGKTWTLDYLTEAKRKKRPVSLNQASMLSEQNIWVVGDEGTILNTENGGKKWTVFKFQEKNYTAVYFANKTTGYIGGEKGMFIYTDNGGEKWTRSNLPSPTVRRFVPGDGGIIAVGDAGMVLKSVDKGTTWQGSRGSNVVGYLLNFFAPFIFIWLLFLLTYIALPNMKIPFKAAAVGASFTGAVWVGFILIFIVYVKSFATGTVAVYGGLAAIPIFLLLVYSSAVIILYGAQIAYTLMHPYSYQNLRRAFKENKETAVYYGIAILYTIYRNFEKGKGPTYFKDLLKATANQADDVDHFNAIFKKEKLIIETGDGGLIPSTSSGNIRLSAVMDIIQSSDLALPTHGSDSLKRYFSDVFKTLKTQRNETLGDITLEKVIDEVG
jgi:membrane protein